MTADRVLAENRKILGAVFFACATGVLIASFRTVSAVPVLVAFVLAALGFATSFHRGLSVVSPFAVVVGALAMTYGVRPLQLLWVPDSVSFADRLDPETFSRAMFAALVFVLSLLAAYCWSVPTRIAERLPLPTERPWTWNSIHRTTLLLALMAVVLYALMLQLTGFSLVGAILQPALFRAQSTRGGLFYISGVALWCLWALFYLNAVQIAKTNGFRKGKSWLLVLFVVLSVLTWPYGARAFLLAPILGIFWIAESVRPEKPLRLLIVVPVGAAMLLFVGAYGVYREVNSNEASAAASVFQRIGAEGGRGLATRVSGRFDSFDFMAWVLGRFATGEPQYLLGRSAVHFLVQPVPRSILPQKPSQTSTYLMETFLADYDRSFTPEFGLATEGYINFSWPGIVLSGAFFGFLVRMLDSYLRRARFAPSILFAYAPMVTAPMGWLLAGFNSFASIMFVLNAVLAVAVVRYIERRA